MAEAQLRQFLDKVRQLNAFVAMSEADPLLRQELSDCEHHDQVVALARRCGFEIGRRWGEHGSSPPRSDVGQAGDRTAAAGSIEGPEHEDDLARSPEPAQPQGGALGLPMPEAPAPSDGSTTQAADTVASGPQGESLFLRSLLAAPCPPAGEEISELLVQTPLWRLERIHSCAARSPAGFWYEQKEEEWVLLLQGSASLRFADQPHDLPLRRGDSLWIRAGRRHRVTATDPEPGTIWLALFWRPV